MLRRARWLVVLSALATLPAGCSTILGVTDFELADASPADDTGTSEDAGAVESCAPDASVSGPEECSVDGWCVVPVPSDTGPLRDVWGASDTDVWAVGDRGTILRFDGSAFRREASGTTLDLHDVWGANATDVWIVGQGGLVLSRATGAWVPTIVSPSTDLKSISGRSASEVIAVGTHGAVYRFDGASWSVDPTPATVTLTSVAAAAEGDFVAGGGGTLLVADGSWRTSPPFTTSELLSIARVAPWDVWIGAGAGLIARFDGATAPATSTLAETESIFALWGSGASDVWAAGTCGALVHFDGAAWSARQSGTTEPIKGLAGTGGAVWAVGGSGIVLRFFL